MPIREENGFAFSAEETLALITPKTRLLILNSPANPTGGVTPKEEIDKLVAGLARFPDVAIMSDEIYGQMTYDGLAHQTLLAYPEIRDRLILLDGWSKTYAMTGWRLGYSVWPKPLYDAARKLAVNSYSCVNASAQYRRARGAHRAAGRGRTRWCAEFDRRRQGGHGRPERAAGRSAATPKGAFYAFPNISRPAGRRSRSPPRCWRRPASPPSAGRISASMARAISASATPTRRRTSARLL